MPASSKIVCAAALLGCARTLAQAPQVPCATSVPSAGGVGVGASWDLSSLYNTSSTYQWQDNVDASTLNATYIFNVCGNIPSMPLSCQVQQRHIAPAYQIHGTSADPSCYALGADLGATPLPANAVTWSLIDPKNPAAGVALTYQGGDSDFCDFPRAFTLNFRCSSANGSFPAAGVVTPAWIEEVNRCQYVANSFSPAGCPTQCPVSGGRVCSGKGICGWDGALSAARCFCDDGSLTADCGAAPPSATTASAFPTGAVAGSVVGGLVVGAAGVAATLLVLQRRGGAGAKAAPVEGFYGQ